MRTPPEKEYGNQIRLLPNLITLTRVILIIPIALLFPVDIPRVQRVVLVLILISYTSDFFDGFVARRFRLQSRLGFVLDPFADKLWCLVMIYLLLRFRDFPVWIAAVIIFRDVCVVLFNSLVYRRRRSVLAPDWIGRAYIMMVGFSVILFTMKLSFAIWIAYIAAVLAPISLIRYGYIYRNVFSQTHRRRVPAGHAVIKD